MLQNFLNPNEENKHQLAAHGSTILNKHDTLFKKYMKYILEK